MKNNKVKYFIEGMHCAACPTIIERKIKKIEGVISVKSSLAKNEVEINCDQDHPRTRELGRMFKNEGYKFYEMAGYAPNSSKSKNIYMIFGLSLLIIIGFLLINKTGISGLVSVNANSSWPTFFFFGLLAGLSTCAALVGGIILSMSKQWSDLYGEKETFRHRAQPHILFNIGRIVSYTFFGLILGVVGSKLQLSLTFYSVMIFGVSVMMIFFGLQLFGIKSFQRFQLRLPRFITDKVSDETKFNGKTMPLIMGALTFLLPCGFTITVQGMALLSGSAIQGALIMMFFALGSLTPLLAIGMTSIKFYEKPKLALNFSKVAGILVLFFALYNINAQLNVLGVSSFSDIKIGGAEASDKVVIDDGLPPVVDGVQVLNTEASSRGYSPKNLKVRAGIPVRWEILDTGTSGCTSAIISRNLFSGEIALTPGQTSIKNFTPQTPGVYKYSCWMGMVSGTIEVI
ncbi:MAG: sulfite exporter TauE/SafE family protein [bacterium]|nr:sulfite exporter TauE/SafE family protein [bacterium]